MNFVDDTDKTELNNQESTLTSIKSSNKKHSEFIQFKKTDILYIYYANLYACICIYIYIYI